MKKRKMFFRMITASLLRRRSRMVIALLAVMIGATILSGLVTIYYDVPRQMRQQFRNYGANMLFTSTGKDISEETLQEGLAGFSESDLVGVAPYRYVSVRINERPLMAAGTNMEGAKKTSPFWAVSGAWPEKSGEIMVGAGVAETFRLREGDKVTVAYTPETKAAASESAEESTAAVAESVAESMSEAAVDSTAEAAAQIESMAEVAESAAESMAKTTEGAAESMTESAEGAEAAAESMAESAAESTAEPAESTDSAAADAAGTTGVENASAEDEEILMDLTRDFTVVGILDTGGSEESYVYMSLEDMADLTQTPTTYDICELSVSASPEQLQSYADGVTDGVDGMNARLVKRVTESETTVLSKLQALVLLVTIVVLALTMICVATTMTAVVAERRKEIGLRKALGASDSSIIMEFTGESLMLGAAGGLLGSILGFLFAQAVSNSVFNSSISFRFGILPLTVIASIIVTGLASLIPIRSATNVDPAIVLKGE